MIVSGHYTIRTQEAAFLDMVERAGLKAQDTNETMIQILINEDDFCREESKDTKDGTEVTFTDADLISFGKEANEFASHWLGYEGWRARRNGRSIYGFGA